MKAYETVILAEKPSQARLYAEAFSSTEKKDGYILIKSNEVFKDGAIIIWALGHLLEIPAPAVLNEKWSSRSLNVLPIDPPEIVLQVKEDTKKIFEVSQRFLPNAKKVIVATDDDREGENIAWSIIEYLKINPKSKIITRIQSKSFEKDVVLKAFINEKPAEQFYLRYIEARTRMFADYLIGMNASTLYSLLLKEKGIQESFSVGRVQTPTLALINERERAMREFVAKPFYENIITVNHPNGNFEAKAEGKHETRNAAEKIISDVGLTYKASDLTEIAKVTKTLERTKSPKLYTLSSLQTRLNKKVKFSPAKTLKTVQALYEKKYLTYPRTAIPYITDAEYEYLKNRFKSYTEYLNLELSIEQENPNSKHVNNKKVVEHFAIIPTKIIPKASSLTDDERTVYDEVLKNTMAMFLNDYTYEKTVIEINKNHLVYKASGNVEIDKGWKVLLDDNLTEDSEEKPTTAGLNKEKVLPIVQEGDPIQITPMLKEGKTTKPKRYTEGDLITAMKNPMNTLTDEEIAELAEEEATEFQLGTEATRTPIIETLKAREYIEIKKNLVYITPKGEILCQALKGTLLTSASMTAKWEAFLKLIGEGQQQEQTFITSINAFILKLIEEAPEQVRSEATEHYLKAHKEANSISGCPLCKVGHIVDKGSFYGCSSKECKQSFSKELLSKKISATQLKKILTKKKSDLIKGFKGKKEFDAYLELEQKENKYGYKLAFK
ncbi:DNA topoisomerase [Solibacillus sp. FSL W7-1436]|uniref:type IA DNA topoisomerase n=1 Tax=Solibacillus sp. FSL W7-1436 TaxID=2921705 RepID=UPI0030F8C5B9